MNLHMSGHHSVGDFLFLYISIAVGILMAVMVFQKLF